MNRITNLRSLTGMSAVLGLAVLSTGAFAQFSAGNIVVSQVTTNAGAASSAANAVSLVEYTPAGIATTKIVALPTVVNGANKRLTDSGSATSDSRIKLSQDGRFITVPGYDAVLGSASVTGTASATVNRVIGLVNVATGAVDTTTALTDAYSGNNIRSAVTIDGTSFYTAGTGTNPGVRYVSTVGATTSVQLETAPTNIRTVDIYAGKLYFSSGSSPYLGLNTLNVALPTTSGATSTNLFSGQTAASQYDFFFASPTVVYIADDSSPASGGGVQKWVNTGTTSTPTWTKEYTITAGLNTTSGASSVAGTTNPDGTVTLYVVTGNGNPLSGGFPISNALATASDTIANTTLPATSFTTLATSPANTVYRGIVVLNPVTTGTISLQGVTDPTATVIPVPPVSIRVKGTVTDFTQSVQLPSTGAYYLTNLSGNFGIGVKGDRQLQSVANVTIGGTQNFSLVGGDIQVGDGAGNYAPNNNIVDVDDLTDLLFAFNTVKGDGSNLYETHSYADLDYNGKIDVDDLTILLFNFNVSGDTL